MLLKRACEDAEKEGFEVDVVPVTKEGLINVEELKNMIREDTILVSIIAVDSEIGLKQPIEEIGELLKDYPKVFSWLLTGLGVVSLLLSIWPYYKPSISEVRRVSWPGKKTMLENCITVFIFVIVFIAFFTSSILTIPFS